jgi:transposase
VTVDVRIEAEIRRLYYAEHFRIGTISTQLGLHHDVVRRVVGVLAPGRMPPPRPSLVLPFAGFIDDTLRQYPRLCSTRLFDMLAPRGYEGSVRTLRDYVATVRPVPKGEVFLRTEPMIGEQAQIDWAHVGKIPVPGGERALWVFVMVLAYSRAMWAELVLEMTAACLRRSLVRACFYFEGATRQWLFDNPKIVVLERHGDAVRFHPGLLELAGLLHVQPRLCGVRKPQQKGRVERAVRYLRDRFFAARTIFSVEQGNRELIDFLERIALPRPHPRWPDRCVGDVLDEERARLLKLPDALPETDLVLSVPVDKTASIRFDTNTYSVPPEHAQHRARTRKLLTLVASDTTVRVLDGHDEVTRHTRCWGRGQLVELPEHRDAILSTKRGARDGKWRDRLRAELPGIDTLFERWVSTGRNVGWMVAQVCKLLDLYGADLMAAAVTDAVARGTHDPGALAVVCEQKRRAKNRPVPIDLELGAHVPDKDVIPHSLETYDDAHRRRR